MADTSGVFSGYLKKVSLAGTGGGRIALSLPRFTASAASSGMQTSGELNLPLPILLLSISGTDFEYTTGYLCSRSQLPLVEVDGGSWHTFGFLDKGLPGLNLVGSSSATLGRFNKSLPRISLIAGAYSGTTGNLTKNVFRLTSTIRGYTSTSGSLFAYLPIIELVAESPGTFVCYVLNTDLMGVTRYTNFAFNSLAEFNGKVILAGPSGLFELGGDSDNGSSIPATVCLGLSDGGSSGLKKPVETLLGIRSGGSVKVQIIADDVTGQEVEATTTMDSALTRRAKAELGLRGRYIGAKITNDNGANFTLDTVELVCESLDRELDGQ